MQSGRFFLCVGGCTPSRNDRTHLVSRQVQNQVPAELLRGGRIQVQKVAASHADAQVLVQLPCPIRGAEVNVSARLRKEREMSGRLERRQGTQTRDSRFLCCVRRVWGVHGRGGELFPPARCPHPHLDESRRTVPPLFARAYLHTQPPRFRVSRRSNLKTAEPKAPPRDSLLLVHGRGK